MSTPSPPPELLKERRRSLRSNSSTALNNSSKGAVSSNNLAYPSVAIVLPTRGYRSTSIQNWQAILNLDYNLDYNLATKSHLEFIFVLEDTLDVANPLIKKLVTSKNRNSARRISARIVYSGHASKSSQKIHNLIAGISAATTSANNHSYVLCLDDDVHVHPTALVSLIRDMEASPELRIATGYPFDIPAEHAGIFSYAVLAYHLPLVIGFSLTEKTHFVWGGCMLFRAQDVRQEDDLLGFLSGWADGGYSDDLTVAARCTELGLHVLCPSYALFPQYLDASYSPRRYWNYLRRQLVVLDTYSSDHNRRTNHVMAVLHCYFSWAFVVPVVSCVVKVGTWVALQSIHAAINLLIVRDRSFVNDRDLALGSSFSSSSRNDNFNSLGYVSALSFIICSFYAAICLRWMTRVFCTVMEKLNPQTLPASSLLKRFHWGKLWVGFIAANAVLPVCMVYTFMTRHITWAGVKYRRSGGKIISVEH